MVHELTGGGACVLCVVCKHITLMKMTVTGSAATSGAEGSLPFARGDGTLHVPVMNTTVEHETLSKKKKSDTWDDRESQSVLNHFLDGMPLLDVKRK